MVNMTEAMEGPVHPVAPGGRVPDLHLAGADGWSVASGKSILPAVPTPEPPEREMPSLKGSPAMGGIDPAVPFYDLNLAGAQGSPAPQAIAQPAAAKVNEPDFASPVMDVPALKPYDLTAPGITSMPEFEADPLLPDLEEYRRPLGLDRQATGVMDVDPLVSDLLPYMVPEGLSINHHPMMADPCLPDLQHPDLTQEVEMAERPGDLALHAMDVMRGTTSYQQAAEKSYPEAWMDQGGVNATRNRHLSLLDYGMTETERG